MTQKNRRHLQFHRSAKQAPKETYLECLKISELQKSCVLKQKQAEIMLQKIAIFWCYWNKNQKQRKLTVMCAMSQRIH